MSHRLGRANLYIEWFGPTEKALIEAGKDFKHPVEVLLRAASPLTHALASAGPVADTGLWFLGSQGTQTQTPSRSHFCTYDTAQGLQVPGSVTKTASILESKALLVDQGRDAAVHAQIRWTKGMHSVRPQCWDVPDKILMAHQVLHPDLPGPIPPPPSLAPPFPSLSPHFCPFPPTPPPPSPCPPFPPVFLRFPCFPPFPPVSPHFPLSPAPRFPRFSPVSPCSPCFPCGLAALMRLPSNAKHIALVHHACGCREM